jgi:hypothetical protein
LVFSRGKIEFDPVSRRANVKPGRGISAFMVIISSLA